MRKLVWSRRNYWTYLFDLAKSQVENIMLFTPESPEKSMVPTGVGTWKHAEIHAVRAASKKYSRCSISLPALY